MKTQVEEPQPKTPSANHSNGGSQSVQLMQTPLMQRRAQEQADVINPGPRPPNRTGLPDRLKAGVEALSGYDLSDVRVHYNSGKPAQLNALAYTQGTDIHVGPGQEKHLPHEAWHVVQQKQNRVRATMKVGEMLINNTRTLEEEAEKRGDQVTQRNVGGPAVSGTEENLNTIATDAPWGRPNRLRDDHQDRKCVRATQPIGTQPECDQKKKNKIRQSTKPTDPVIQRIILKTENDQSQETLARIINERPRKTKAEEIIMIDGNYDLQALRPGEGINILGHGMCYGTNALMGEYTPLEMAQILIAHNLPAYKNLIIELYACTSSIFAKQLQKELLNRGYHVEVYGVTQLLHRTDNQRIQEIAKSQKKILEVAETRMRNLESEKMMQKYLHYQTEMQMSMTPSIVVEITRYMITEINQIYLELNEDDNAKWDSITKEAKRLNVQLSDIYNHWSKRIKAGSVNDFDPVLAMAMMRQLVRDRRQLLLNLYDEYNKLNFNTDLTPLFRPRSRAGEHEI